MDAQQYLDTVEQSLTTGGYTVDRYDLGGWPAVVGYRSDFKLRWMASRLHLFVCVSSAPEATADALAGLTASALEYAKAAKGAMRGMQSGVAVISVLAADHVDESAHAYARKEMVRNFAAFAWPVVVDLSTGKRTSHVGRPALGAVFTGWMREQVVVAAPEV